MTMTMRHDPSHTAQPERKLNWSSKEGGEVSQREKGYELPLLFTLINFIPCEVLCA